MLIKLEHFNDNYEYTEIEFICHNSNYPNSTPIESQLILYDELKKLEVKLDYNIKVYRQDFSDDDHTEISMAVIILDNSKLELLKSNILEVSNKIGVRVDLINKIGNRQLDSIIKGDYPNLI